MELTNIFVMAVGLLSVLTNGVLLFILVKDPLKCFKASTTYFIICLSFSDLLTGANACFWSVHQISPFSQEVRKYMLALFWITIQVSFLTLLAMSVERFLIVKYPLYCRIWITKKRVSLFIALIWLVSTLLGGLVILPPPKLYYVQFSIFTEFFLSVFAIAGLYAVILLGIKNSQKAFRGNGGLHKGGGHVSRETSTRGATSGGVASYEINVTATSDTNEVPSDNDNPLFPGNIAQGMAEHGTGETSSGQGETARDKHPIVETSKGKKSREWVELRGSSTTRKQFARVTQSIMKSRERCRKIQQEKKLTAVVLLLVGVLAVTVLPYLLAMQIFVGYVIFCKCPMPDSLIKFTVIYFPIELLNFAVNPLIYAWRLPQYRRTLRYLCCRSRYQASGNAETTSARD